MGFKSLNIISCTHNNDSSSSPSRSPSPSELSSPDLPTRMVSDRPPPVTRAPTARPATRNAGAGGVRRNLFQSQLTRRPTPTSSSTSAETLRLDVDVLSDTSDIVIRDKNGEFEVGDPPPPHVDELGMEALDDLQENERERQKLAEVVKHHQINLSRTPTQPEEVLEALRASMRAQVAALSEDNWMYEPDEPLRGQGA